LEFNIIPPHRSWPIKIYIFIAFFHDRKVELLVKKGANPMQNVWYFQTFLDLLQTRYWMFLWRMDGKQTRSLGR